MTSRNLTDGGRKTRALRSRKRVTAEFPRYHSIGGTLARYSIEEYVRWEDIDAAGIINYQAYLRFFGLAEAELLRSAGLNYRYLFENLGIWLPRVRVECNFHLPVKLDELLVVEAFFSRIGRTSVHLDFEVRKKADPAVVVATGRYVLVCVHQGTFEPVEVPVEIRTRIAKYVEPAAKTDALTQAPDR
jgi:acyl-CoA thioester hydrolase